MMFAQSLVFTNAPGSVSTPSDQDIDIPLYVVNTSANPIDVKVRRMSNDVATGHENYFCWDVCYETTTDVSVGHLTIMPGDTNTFFKMTFLPNGNTGASSIMYRFYDKNNPTDLIEYTFEVDATTTSIGPDIFKPNNVLSSPYPNPAKDFTYLDFELNPDVMSAEVRMYNLIGKQVKRESIQGIDGKLRVDTRDLMPGVYFFYMIVDGQEVASRRLIISR